MALPLSSITETLTYNHRLIVDSYLYNEDSEARAWLVSKTKRVLPNGIVVVTMTQDVFDQNNDYIERDDDGKIIGMWADYYKYGVEPISVYDDLISDDTQQSSSQPSTITSQITCSGKKVIKIGGSAKTLTVTFKDEENEIDRPIDGWSFLIGDDILPNDLLLLTPVSDNKVKVKFLGDDSYIGKILTVKCKSGDVEASLDIELQAL